ncbi:ribosomal large subunit pseudouridine synthase A [Chlamydia pneumoniae TW-183]|uniref:Pseudouridine synthase n=3 Tax=Chlamydia pneumoniae TaxID=83558 RepID=Q9Z7I6_CHLPN|nr:RluA family pseudouridine synthase [Chlamydia pneumoniae]AAD18858.1 predicted Pseudouridine Synthase [Chlamydia pneumoniae CWL029]AAF37922.1 ribosomal large subunit pseudouridine synthase D [Chlamydia pneumoniae AR39]AAP98676.1 ribosomal large subunit pseudouridine synthase A [Chlamydia pneumoniae TW-183]ACZ32607.1 pseudouridine synthase, RluA family [Chlamydia pneumoniae LPCoLN]ETR80624.1 Ribosomal large subunit pseudouridine synthase D [Chlamydia pneumoniae B21]
MKTVTSFTVCKENSGRLDKYLTEVHPKYSRAFYQEHILSGLVQINGQINTRVATRLNCGDIVTIDIQEKEELLELLPEAIPLDKVYEDGMILVINKPRDMVVHPAPGHFHGTLVHALLHEIGERLKEEFPEEPWRPGIVHRLDKDTSGLIITAKTRQAKKVFSELFSTKRLKKSYLAVCIGKPRSTTIHTHISRHQNKRKEMTVSSQGKEAVTHCQVLAFNGKLSFVALSPETGRTHQLRVHMKHLGTPILGDPVYGIPSMNSSYGLDKQQLHAYSVDFTHPETRQFCSLKAGLPEDMRSLLIKEFRNETTILNKNLLESILKEQ